VQGEQRDVVRDHSGRRGGTGPKPDGGGWRPLRPPVADVTLKSLSGTCASRSHQKQLSDSRGSRVTIPAPVPSSGAWGIFGGHGCFLSFCRRCSACGASMGRRSGRTKARANSASVSEPDLGVLSCQPLLVEGGADERLPCLKAAIVHLVRQASIPPGWWPSTVPPSRHRVWRRIPRRGHRRSRRPVPCPGR
jgi:hypothetical protein